MSYYIETKPIDSDSRAWTCEGMGDGNEFADPDEALATLMHLPHEPSWSGDYRIVSYDGDVYCTVTVTDEAPAWYGDKEVRAHMEEARAAGDSETAGDCALALLGDARARARLFALYLETLE